MTERGEEKSRADDDRRCDMTNGVRAFLVWSTWFDGDEYKRIVYAENAGKAKYRTWLDITDAYADLPLTSMRSRVLDRLPPPSERFRDFAERRRIPFAKPGMAVEVDGRPGVIVGSNGSLNLDVLIDGQVANCHPWWRVTYFDEAGAPISLPAAPTP